MAAKLNLNTVNQIEKGTVVYAENEQVNSVCLILKGRALVYNNGIKTIMGSGSFLGISDVYGGIHLRNYVAYDNLMVFTFQVSKPEEVLNIVNMNKDYPGLMVSYLNKYIAELSKAISVLRETADKLYRFLSEKYDLYLDVCKKSGYVRGPIRSVENLDTYSSVIELDNDKIGYYVESSKISIETQKAYFSVSNKIALYHVKEQSKLIIDLNSECMELAAYIGEYFESLINDQTDCLYKSIAKLAIELRSKGGKNEDLVEVIDEIIAEINSVESVIMDKAGYRISVDREKMEEIYFTLLTGEKDETINTDLMMKYSDQDAVSIARETENSLKQILNASSLSGEKKAEIEGLIQDFINLKDKESVDDNARLLRRKIAENFYELYQSVFLMVYNTKKTTRVVEMFLNYGYIDESLLNNDQIMELYYLENKEDLEVPCKVYTIKEWLIAVFEGKKEPSKSEFDLDYTENLREMKRTRNISREEEADYLTNPLKRLEYEIHNMFRYNNRVCNGQVSIFIPILHEIMFSGGIQKSFLTSKAVNMAIKGVLDIDFSAFYREVLYFDESKGIKKEYIVKQAFPDIILMPIVGYNPVMWQEISGKKRDAKGRFILPSFVAGDLNDMVIKLVGRFRWELCRTIQGTSWNNITEKSLTSEYVDYIQFYRKNRDLTEERKEKLKIQIQKGKNNSREIFLIDYILWVKNESQGALRLNKTAREILSTYCPFSKAIRERIKNQPLFDEAMSRYIREKNKKNKDIDMKYRALEKEGVTLPEELLETQRFYSEL